MKNKVSKKEPSSGSELVIVMKEVQIKEIAKEYCEILINSMSKRIEAVIRNRGGHIKYKSELFCK